MNTLFTTKLIGLSAACALTLSFAFPAQAADFVPGASIWRNANPEVGAGMAGEWCWNREFNASTPPSGCGVRVEQYVTPAPAPAFVAQASAPASAQPQYLAPVPAQPAPVAVRSERPARKDRN